MKCRRVPAAISGITLILLVSGGCKLAVLFISEEWKRAYAPPSLWNYDEDGASAIVNGNFSGNIDELRVLVSVMESDNDFARVDDPDSVMAKSPDYKTSERDLIKRAIAKFRSDMTYDNMAIDPPRKAGDSFCTVLFIETKEKKIIYFNAGMPKERGLPVTIRPLYDTNSVYSSTKVSQWLDDLFKRGGGVVSQP